ncbi:META domain-containing protein [Sphingomicrobium lutaoense]|uniref:Heat shock protein HslJ/uncharacterized membrane protein n=1 Tax=Sphingomicrobium lutaoense TaxID=515949 RepID=A0A839YXD2_9SPHN|nr:META domain-containing protein [Sphingomicrobium lutaoense]MBB3763839.1 heat shock protein HslJ/uncharacterized membrane protein [Sphingomicrobium lutaoense]
MKMAASLLALALAACTTAPYGSDGLYREPYGGRDYPPYPAPYPDNYGMPLPFQDEPYRAIGTEPFWSLELDGREMQFKTADGLSYREPVPPVRPTAAGEVFEGRRLVMVIEARSCSDGMSDRVYPNSVVVWFDQNRWTGCGAPQSFYREAGEGPPSGNAAMLERTSWTVMSINGQPVPRSGYYINFLPGGSMEARFGCNRISATVTVQGQTLTAGPLQSTRMACADMSMESAASNILGAPAEIALTRDGLTLRNRQGTIAARRAR